MMTEHGLRPNRALGQNFLTDAGVLGRIADAAVADALPLIEIGAGLGALTGALTARGAHVTAIEKDGALAAILEKEFPAARVVCADFLDADMAALTGGGDFCAAGNLPYYVTTPICERLLCALPARAVLMVQAEAAARFFARPGDRVYGPLAVLSQAFYTPEKLFSVPASAFWPQPEVDSAVVRLLRRDAPAPVAPAALLRFLKTAFGMRRKTLFNNFQRSPRLMEALLRLGLPAGIRAEAVAPDALAQICRMMEERS